MLVTDIVLLLIMLGGLFRLRRHSGGASGLIQLLWKQVGWWFSLAITLRFIDMFSCFKGVIWLLLATAAEVPPVVSLASSSRPYISFIYSLCPRSSLF